MKEIKVPIRLVSSPTGNSGNSGNKAIELRSDEDFTGDVANDVMMKVLDLLDGDADLAASVMLLAAADLIGAGDVPRHEATARAAVFKAAILAVADGIA